MITILTVIAAGTLVLSIAACLRAHNKEPAS